MLELCLDHLVFQIWVSYILHAAVIQEMNAFDFSTP